MERIKVSWRDPVAHHVQSAVSELAIDEEFTPIDIHKAGLNRSSEASALIRMNCTKRRERGHYEKTFDPRVLLTKRRPEILPKVCAECYFSQKSTSGHAKDGCIILSDYRIKILSRGLA